jgi:hypothetical protein
MAGVSRDTFGVASQAAEVGLPGDVCRPKPLPTQHPPTRRSGTWAARAGAPASAMGGTSSPRSRIRPTSANTCPRSTIEHHLSPIQHDDPIASAASSISWVMATMVLPPEWSARSTASTAARPAGSSMAVASSRMSAAGCTASAPAIATRCFCPPERRCGGRARSPTCPTVSSASRTRAFSVSHGTPKFSGPKATSSSTTVATIWASGCWKTIWTASRMHGCMGDHACRGQARARCLPWAGAAR